MPNLRQISSTVVPLSAYFSANAICSSVNFDFFMATGPSSGRSVAEFSISGWPELAGGGQCLPLAPLLECARTGGEGGVLP